MGTLRGTLQGLMGAFFLTQSALLIEDVALPSAENLTQASLPNWYAAVEAEFSVQVNALPVLPPFPLLGNLSLGVQGTNCFIAAGLYLATAIAAYFRFRMVKDRL